jgi:hypothetical protein
MFKLDKVWVGLMGTYIASDLLCEYAKKRKRARIDAINADFDAQEAELRKRIALLEAMQRDAADDILDP